MIFGRMVSGYIFFQTTIFVLQIMSTEVALDLEECPEGHPYCTGDCFYYSEDPEERIAKGEEHWDLE